MRNRRSVWLLCLIIVRATVCTAPAFDLSYWVWQREQPLSHEELTQLAARDVHHIYWHIGELENVGETWQWKTRFPFPRQSSIHLVPVVRLVSREHQPFSMAAITALVTVLTPASTLTGELQLDYDAPDRLLDDYGRALAKIHEAAAHLSITALPHWSRADHLHSLAKSVDELFPMLYDFEAEPVLSGDSPQPLLTPEKMAKMLEEWSRCGKPWQAGLPAFARLTVYDAAGKSRGQIRNWNWDEVCLNRTLSGASLAKTGTSLLSARSATVIAHTRLLKGDQLAVRLTERDALRDAIGRAKSSGANGVVLFHLPDSAASSGWSLAQLSDLAAKPQLILRKSDAGDAFVLRNNGGGDLEPRFASKAEAEGGYALEIEADSPIFREAEAGDFAQVTGYAAQSGKMVKVAIPFATRLVFSFSQLRAAQSLQIGLIQLAPGASFRHARSRVQNNDPEWKPLE